MPAGTMSRSKRQTRSHFGDALGVIGLIPRKRQNNLRASRRQRRGCGAHSAMMNHRCAAWKQLAKRGKCAMTYLCRQLGWKDLRIFRQKQPARVEFLAGFHGRAEKGCGVRHTRAKSKSDRWRALFAKVPNIRWQFLI